MPQVKTLSYKADPLLNGGHKPQVVTCVSTAHRCLENSVRVRCLVCSKGNSSGTATPGTCRGQGVGKGHAAPMQTSLLAPAVLSSPGALQTPGLGLKAASL